MANKQPNVLLISADTLRADHLSCYGYPHETSPIIDKMARDGVLLERFFCSGIPTQPSYATLYTGQHPIHHGIVAQGGKADLDKSAPFISQILLGNGYTTCAVDNLLQARAWYARGFEFYIDPSVRRSLMLGIAGEELNARALPWIRQHADETFFIHIHYWDSHSPLRPPAKYKDLYYDTDRDPFDKSNKSLEKWWEHPLGKLARDTWLRRPGGLITDDRYVVALYDQEIRHLDDVVGELLGVLDETGIAEKTLVLFVGDHGESMTEHGIYFSHHGLYDPVIHVPFIARLPGRLPAGRRLSCMAQHQDIAPTILEATEGSIPKRMDGVSFWKTMTGEDTEPKRSFAVSCECSWQAKWSLRTDARKFILARSKDFYGTPDRELYDLTQDPGETTNLVERQPDVAREMESELEGWIRRRLEELGKTQDPLLEEGVSLGQGVGGILIPAD